MIKKYPILLSALLLFSSCEMLEEKWNEFLYIEENSSEYNPMGVLPEGWTVHIEQGGSAMAVEDSINLSLNPTIGNESLTLLYRGGGYVWDLSEVDQNSYGDEGYLSFKLKVNSTDRDALLKMPGNLNVNLSSSFPVGIWVELEIRPWRSLIDIEYALYKITYGSRNGVTYKIPDFIDSSDSVANSNELHEVWFCIQGGTCDISIEQLTFGD